jgi:magnesium-transporting ATPase (P-type)
MLPALALGAEPSHRTAMTRPPRSRRQGLLTAGLILRAYLLLGSFEAVAAMSGYFAVLFAGGWRWGQDLGPADPLYLQATTACLTAIVVAQVVNVFLCRREREPILDRDISRNPRLWWAVVVEVGLILLIVYTGIGNRLFVTAPLPGWAWAAGVPAVAAMVVADELRKRFSKHDERALVHKARRGEGGLCRLRDSRGHDANRARRGRGGRRRPGDRLPGRAEDRIPRHRP